MKTVGKRSAFLYALIVFFCAGICFLVVKLTVKGSVWSSMPYNAHLSDDGTFSSHATILDRNGVTLYSDTGGYDDETKEALVHVLGDKDGYISTGILQMYTSKLSGYNFITGLSSVNGIKKGVTASLTVDSSVCKRAYELLGDRRGAVFIYNYKTGDIICDTSTPSFDPENVPDDITTNEAYNGAFLDKTISCTFTPGSIFKIVTTACAIENLPDWQDYTADCEGSFDIGGSTVTCLDNHGTVDIEDGLKFSCNIVFAKLALELGKDSLMKTANELGFGKTFKYELSNTLASTFDILGAEEIDTAWSGVGQYTDLVSPYHMAVLLGSIANGGTSPTPHIVNKIVSPLGIPTLTSSADNLGTFMKKITADTIKSLLRNNVENYYGDSMFPGMNVCAKTGTAQVGEGKADTAWMVGFSDNDATPYAFAVVIEEGGSGYTAAGAIASELMIMLG